MTAEDCKRPVMPNHFTTAKADEAAELVAAFKAWYNCPTTMSMIEEAVGKTEKFLVKYDHTPTAHGGIGESKPWIHLEDVPLPDLAETKDEVRFDLRFSGLRLKTFAEGTCRLLGILNEMEALPTNANSYNDRATNLAEFFVHERLMRSYLQHVAAGEKPEEKESLKLSDLLQVYLYAPGAQQGPIRAKVVQMVSLGLWDADPPTETRNWKIRAGVVAVRFHIDVFTPVVAHFKPQLWGGYSTREVTGNAA
ncbi:hypothetical protein ACC697_03825 [Rhizobium ruizarguesonis]